VRRANLVGDQQCGHDPRVALLPREVLPAWSVSYSHLA
jgi:hypothetical protein